MSQFPDPEAITSASTGVMGVEAAESTSGNLRKRMVRGAIWSTLNSIGLRFIGMSVNIVLARILAPQYFGVVAVAVTLQSVLGALADLGVAADLIRVGDIARRGPTTATLGLVAGGSLTLLMFAGAQPFASAMGVPEAAAVVRTMSFTLLLAGLGVVPYAVMQREIMQGRQLAVDSAGLAVSTTVTICLAVAGWGAMSIAIGRVAAAIVVLVLQFTAARMLPRFGLDRTLLPGILKFGVPVALANLLSWVVLGIDNVIVGSQMGAVSLGLYVVAFNVSSWPMNAVGQVIRSIAFPGFVRSVGTRDMAQRSLRQASALAWTLSIPLGLGLSLFALQVVSVVYGSNWAPSAVPLAGLGAFGAVRVIFDVVVSFLYARGSSRSVLIVQVLWLITLAPAMIVGIERWGLAGAAWAHLAVALLVVLPGYLVALGLSGVSPWVVLGRAVVPIAAGSIAGLAALVASQHLDTSFSQLLVGAMTFCVVYLLLTSRWFMRQEILRSPRLRAHTPPVTSA